MFGPALGRGVRSKRMRVHVRLLVAMAALLATAAGCGAARDATEKELAELRAEVARLRAAQGSLGERVDNLELDRGAFGKAAAGAAPTATPGADKPELSVVRLAPSEGDGDVDSGAPRPMIRAVGNDGSIQKGKTKDASRKGAGPKKPDAR